MKKILLTLIVLISALSGKSQNLSGTQWLGTNAPSPNIWFNFGNDTVYYSFTGGGFSALSLYTAASGQFAIMDLSGTALCTDTGFYNYTYIGSTLTFTLISDGCASRRNTLLNYNWMLIGTTGIESTNNLSSITISPNPSTNGIYTVNTNSALALTLEIIVTDLSGKIVFVQQIKESETRIDLSLLAKGTYMCRLKNNNSAKSILLIR